MRDVLEDDERKIQPVSLLLIATAAVLSSMIVYNAFTASNARTQLQSQASTRMQVTVPDSATAANTVVFKYDAEVENVQRELLATGHYRGLVDGVMGQRTAQAIQQYQQDNGLSVTGQVSPDLVNHIRYTRKVKAAAEFTGSIEPAPATKPTAPNKRQSILRVQLTLASLGYDLGDPTGVLDDPTRAAVLQYELDNGLAMDGVIDDALLKSISKISTKSQTATQ